MREIPKREDALLIRTGGPLVAHRGLESSDNSCSLLFSKGNFEHVESHTTCLKHLGWTGLLIVENEPLFLSLSLSLYHPLFYPGAKCQTACSWIGTLQRFKGCQAARPTKINKHSSTIKSWHRYHLNPSIKALHLIFATDLCVPSKYQHNNWMGKYLMTCQMLLDCADL